MRYVIPVLKPAQVEDVIRDVLRYYKVEVLYRLFVHK
jgi:hypothetical protein